MYSQAFYSPCADNTAAENAAERLMKHGDLLEILFPHATAEDDTADQSECRELLNSLIRICDNRIAWPRSAMPLGLPEVATKLATWARAACMEKAADDLYGKR